MNRPPIISLFGSANRPWLWPRLHNSISLNEVPFEIIVVSDQQPQDFTLPDNFHFIYSEVKPAQCAEIAKRHTTGDLIMPIADDLVFSEHALDVLHRTFLSLDNDKAVVSARYYCNGQIYTDPKCRFWNGDLNSPLLSVAGLSKKQMWEQLGGIDRRFVALAWNIDMVMRIYEIGGCVTYCEEAKVVELHDKSGPEKGLFNDVGFPLDMTLLDWLWARQSPLPKTVSPDSVYSFNQEKGILMKNRLSPVMPFEDKHILTVSQGYKGKWK